MCRQDYVTQYAEQYMGKVFFFCLKKTGGPQEAEDLASDISLCILSELKRGVVPVHFPAWVWQIAKNRYSRWADRKRKRTERFYGGDISVLEIAEESMVEDWYLKSEEISLLKRELAFISYDYRRILLAYYMEERTIREIAEREKLSEGAVKMRLLRARNILKEGMDMAREFGTKSYKPEEINFLATGDFPSGLPWSAVTRMLPKNILLQADNNPSTIEELSMELGIAAPYMEEECRLLHKATLLKKTGEKYVTNFIILDKECQHRIYQAQLEDLKERSRLTDSMAEELEPVLERLSVVRNGMAKEEVKWFLVIYILDYCIIQCDGYRLGNSLKARKNGETWGFIGYEKADVPGKKGMGHNGNGNSDAMFWAYKIGGYNMWNRAGEMKYQQTLLLGDLLRNRRDIATLTDSEKAVWEEICGRFAHLDEKGAVVPDILIFEGNAMQEFQKAIEGHPHFHELMKYVQAAFDKTCRVLESGRRSISREEQMFCASMQIFDIRMMNVEDEVENGRLTVPEEPEKSTLAMYMVLSPVQ